MVRRIVVAAALGAFMLAAAPVMAPDASQVGGTAQAADLKVTKAKTAKAKRATKPAASDASDTGGQVKQMRMQANPPGSRFPYSYRY